MENQELPEVKKVSLSRPVEVRMGRGEVFFVTLHADGMVEIRPKGARDPSSTVHLTIPAIYKRALINRAPPLQRMKRKR